MTLKKINWAWVIAGVLLIALAWILLRGCYQPAKIGQVREVVVVDTAAVGRLTRELANTRNHERLAVEAKDSVHRILVREQFYSRNWAHKYREAIGRKDTVLALERCDSLANEVELLNETLDQFKAAYDHIADERDSTDIVRDSLAALHAGYLAQYRNAYQATLSDRNDLAKQLGRTQRKVKRERLLTRVLAGAVIGLAGYAALK
jgi:TusA-related sulfurtransferase